ncbi:MAG: tRNA (guanosine(46)-N7)-methyltransferase TrmB [Holophagales bacterium]|jgi:tRNA (guanine-N7-)-methyltransferase|nr:tRNA (guanosine(46)-N7)-methyltransferase TrmB [Holophagales bacterium]
MRLRNIANARKTLEQHPEMVILDPARHKGLWKKIFENNNPIFLEIGMGKGQFICDLSERMSDVNFLGLEKYDSVMFRALQRLVLNPRQNVLLLRGEAENLLEYFAPGEIERLYLNFSDPWPRKGNIKRRLTHMEFLDRYKIILVPDGEIHIKTDNRLFFEFTLQHMNKYGMRFELINLDLHAKEPKDNIRTEYEESRSAAGAVIYLAVCKFIG